MNKQQLASKIWQSANKMRSKIEANDYKDYILGFVFYKFLCEEQTKYLKVNEFSDEDIKQTVNEENSEIVKFVQDARGCFIAYEHLFSTWINNGKDFDVSNVRDALSAFARLISPSHRKVYDKIFNTLETGLSRLGDSSRTQTKAISDLIHLIDDIPMNGRQDYDVLGFIYEYLISMFAANAGKKAGEFYTPHEVSLLMSEIIAHHLKDRKTIEIYDPTSGSGSLLINIGHSVAKHSSGKIRYYAQELKENTYNLTRMNLVMRGINPADIVTRNADTLEDDWPIFEDNDPVGTYQRLYVDAVVSNPPYSQAWDSSHKENDPRYAGFGLAPKTKADFAFLLHDLYHLKPDGMMAIVLPHGVLFRGGEEERIRTNLIEKNHIDAVIGLPANIFFGTGIPTIIMILRQKRENTDVLFIDASKGFSKEGKQNKLQAAHIKKITDTIIQRKDTDKYARKVSQQEIREQSYNLNIPRYIDSAEAEENHDIYAIMNGGIPQCEINELALYWQAFPSLKSAVFAPSATQGYCQINTDNIADTITRNRDIQAFTQHIQTAFADFSGSLKKALITPLNHLDSTLLDIAKTESALSDDIFARLHDIALLDPYTAYQHFADHWQTVAADLETIQSDGKTAIKVVDANMVIKKKDGKETEEQDGYIGRILPFELVQHHYLADELAVFQAQENRLADIAAEYETLLENLSEEDKESPAINETGDGIISAEASKCLNAALEETYGKLSKKQQTEKLNQHTFSDGSLEQTLQRYLQLNAQEKTLKADIKKQSAALHLKTKETVENLNNEQIEVLLTAKWITPLVAVMSEQSGSVQTALTQKIRYLTDKYAQSLTQIDAELKAHENALANLLGELVGSQEDMLGLAQLQKMLRGGV